MAEDGFDFSKLEEEMADATANVHIADLQEGAITIAKLIAGIHKGALEAGLSPTLAEALAARYMSSILFIVLREGEV